jgi:hypothetical protein
MTFDVADILSIASGRDNEDRAGVASELAWVIDGATDVIPEPLTRATSDAAWFAAAMHDMLDRLDTDTPPSLAELPGLVADRLAPQFVSATSRPAAGREEHPSAAAIVIRRLTPGRLEFVSLGDCALIVESEGRMTKIGVSEDDAGDRWVADALTGKSQDAAIPGAPLTRIDLWPILRAKRARMNTPAGYGIFSVTPPPREMIRHGTLEVSPASRILLATDGLLRLVDVFGTYDIERLFAAAWANGLAPLFDELRALETADADCTRFPRAKTSDDTTALLLRVSA